MKREDRGEKEKIDREREKGERGEIEREGRARGLEGRESRSQFDIARGWRRVVLMHLPR